MAPNVLVSRVVPGSRNQHDSGESSVRLWGAQRAHTPRQIRAQILANLHRWKDRGVWGRAYEEWQDIASGSDDGRLFAKMLGRDEEAVRLRQSAPFVGLLPKERQLIIIGSQALHGKYPDVADQILTSFEVDLIASKRVERTEWLNAIGVDSQFHETYGYYADAVDIATATLPKAWKGRLVNLPPGDTDGVRGLCLDPHDLAIAKYAACREKDLVFTRELAGRGITSKKRLLELLEQTDISGELRGRVRGRIAAEFDPPAPD